MPVAVGNAGGAETAVEPLPELARVYWRRPLTEETLRQRGRGWTLATLGQTIPLVGGAIALALLKPVTIPVGVCLLIHAWVFPELYAARGAGVLRRRRHSDDTTAERVAAGLLGDLVDHAPRELFARCGMVTERGRLGVWLLGEAGAVLVRPGGRRVFCFCVKATDGSLPRGDRVAHLLLALRTDEIGFATVANGAFSGASWRLARRLDARGREGLAAARRLAAASNC